MPYQPRAQRLGWGMLVALCCVQASCSSESKPARHPPPPPPTPALTPAATTPPVATAEAPSAPEAGTVALGAAMLVGGNGLSDAALDHCTDDFRAVFAANQGPFRRCYAAAAERTAGLTGGVKAKVVIAGDGRVYDLIHRGGSVTDPELVQCTLRALASLPYRPHPGQLFAVETPIEYSP